MRRKKDNNEFGTLKGIFESSQVPEKLMPNSIKILLDRHGYKKPKRNIGRIVTSCTAVAAAAALAVGLVKYSKSDELSRESIRQYAAQHISTMHFAKDYGEVFKYLSDIKEKNPVDVYGIPSAEEDIDYAEYEDTEAVKKSGSENSGNNALSTDGSSVSSDDSEAPDYSDTYNQEEGVLEADIVKTDGKTIYYASGSQLHSVDVKDGKFGDMRSVQNKNSPDPDDKSKNTSTLGIVRDLYLYDDKLIVITDLSDMYSSHMYLGCYKTGVLICDKQTLEIKDRYVQVGLYTDVRLRDDGQLYLVTNDNEAMRSIYNYNGLTVDDTEKYIPSYEVNGKKQTVSCDDILLPTDEDIDEHDYYYDVSFINIAALDLDSDTPCVPTDVKTIVGTGYNVYCSYDNLYITGGYDETDITRLALTDNKVIPRAGTTVKGYVNDQFSMSEYNGYFRIATTYDTYDISGISGADRNNVLYVLDMELKEVGRISNFGLDEDIKSVNFSGNTAYVVTFRNTDPLFAIDMSDPTNPVITDELKITGYSGYMQKWTDGVLLGFGENGDAGGNLNGVKLSMFDNSDLNNLKLLDFAAIKAEENIHDPHSQQYYEDVWSAALYDRKALLILPEKNIIGIPYNTERINLLNGNTTQDTEHISTSGYRFYSFDGDKLHELGDLSDTLEGKANDYDYNRVSEFERCVLIGDYIYILSDSKIISADVSAIAKTDTIELPQPQHDPKDDIGDAYAANGVLY